MPRWRLLRVASATASSTNVAGIRPTAMGWEAGGMKSTQEPLGTEVMEGITVEGFRVASIVTADGHYAC